MARIESPTPYADTLIPIRLYGWRTAGEATLSNPIESACDESVPAWPVHKTIPKKRSARRTKRT